MTNTSQPNDSSDSNDTAGQTESGAKDFENQEVPEGMLPLVEPVFGKNAFLITAVPFLVYLLGTGLGSYFENVRKTNPAHTIRGNCRTMASNLRESFNDNLDKEVASDVFAKIDLAQVETAINDESGELSKLVQDCDKLRNVDLATLPESTRGRVKQLQTFVTTWLELDEKVESGDLEDIIPTYSKFLEENIPDADIPKMTETWYPTLYTVACIAAFIAVLFALPGFLKHPFRISPFAIGIGVVGIFVWLGLWWLDKHVLGIGEWMAPNSRAAFNPFVELGPPKPKWWMYTFVGIRLLGLCLVIPIAEEFFARGFLMRYIEDIDWDQIPLGEATWKGLAGIIVYGAMTHPGEIVAAVAWFGLITWMYLKTKNIWDCVVAHSITNALLAAFVIATGTWELW